MFESQALPRQEAAEEHWLDLQEIGTLEGCTRRKIHKNIQDGRYPEDKIRCVPSRGPGGRKWQVHLSALSPEVQRRYWSKRTASIEDRIEAILAKQTEPPPDPTQEELGRASKRELREAARKAALVEEFRRLRGKPARAAFAARHRVPLTSIYRWMRRYDGAAASLLPKFTGRKPSAGYLTARQVAVELYLRPQRPTPEQVLRAMAATLPPEALPSRATLYRWLNDEQLLGGRGQATYIRWGEKAYRDTAEPVRRRDWNRIAVNHTWNGDHHELDLLVILPDGTIGRPWLTAWQDCRSRAIVGYTLNLQPNAMEIGLALRAGILPKDDEPFQGMPVQIYADNGKDYRSKLLNGETIPVFRQTHEDPIWGLFGHLGIKTRFCEAYHGKSKPIERFFRSLEEGWLCLMQGYCGRAPQHRPAQLEDDMAATQKWLQSDGAQGERRLMTWWEMEEEIAEAIHAYNRRPHASLGWAVGKGYSTPAEVYAAGLSASVRLPARETLDILILPSATRQVRNDGIHLDRLIYWHPDLAPVIGQEVEVRYNPRDRQEILVLRKGAFLAWAQVQTGVAPFAETKEDRKELQEFLRGNAALRRAYRERRKELLAHNPLAAMAPAARELAPQGVVVQMPHITGYDRAVRAAARAKRREERPEVPPTAAQAVAVAELLVFEYQKGRKEDRS